MLKPEPLLPSLLHTSALMEPRVALQSESRWGHGHVELCSLAPCHLCGPQVRLLHTCLGHWFLQEPSWLLASSSADVNFLQMAHTSTGQRDESIWTEFTDLDCHSYAVRVKQVKASICFISLHMLTRDVTIHSTHNTIFRSRYHAI